MPLLLCSLVEVLALGNDQTRGGEHSALVRLLLGTLPSQWHTHRCIERESTEDVTR